MILRSRTRASSSTVDVCTRRDILAMRRSTRLASARIDTRELFGREHEALHRLAADDVALDDLVDVRDGDVAVPGSLGVDDDRDAVRALVEAAGLVRAH